MMGADDLAICIARSTAAMMLTIVINSSLSALMIFNSLLPSDAIKQHRSG